MSWYVSRGQVKRGPISDADFRRHILVGHILPSDLVWRDTMQEWKSAGDVDGLFQRPPPLQSNIRAALSTSSSSTNMPHMSNERSVNTEVSRGGYLGAHWQGRLGLATSFWLNVVLAGLLFPLIIAILIGAASAVSSFAAVVVVVASPLVYLAFVIWQCVGLYRCAMAHIVGSKITFKPWAHLAIIYSVAPVHLLPLLCVAIIGGVSALGTQTDAKFNEIASQLQADDY